MLLFHSHKPENDWQRITSRMINHASMSCLQGGTAQQSASKHYFRYSHFPRVHQLSMHEKNTSALLSLYPKVFASCWKENWHTRQALRVSGRLPHLPRLQRYHNCISADPLRHLIPIVQWLHYFFFSCFFQSLNLDRKQNHVLFFL